MRGFAGAAGVAAAAGAPGFADAAGGSDFFAPNAAVADGGCGADVFDIDALLTGSVNGEAGSDTLRGDQVINATVTSSAVNGYTGTADGVTAGYQGINVLTGDGVGGTLTGANVASSTWSLAATQTYNDNAGNGTLTFSSFSTLRGNVQVDTFNVTANNAVNLAGGNGNDIFDIVAAATLILVDAVDSAPRSSAARVSRSLK